MKKGKKIKIAIFHCGFIYSGGGERIALEEAKGLIKRGYDVDVFAPTVDASKCFPELLRQLKVKPFMATYLKKLPLRNAIRMLASSLMAPIMAFWYAKYDLFIGANQPGAWIAYCMSRVLKKPYIVYLNQPNRIVYPRPVDVEFGWTTTEKDYHFLYRLFRIVKPLFQYLDSRSIADGSKVLTNGAYISDVIENVYSIWVTDTPAGADAKPWKSLVKNQKQIFSGTLSIGKNKIKKPYLLITNRHDPQKRFDYVISALAIVSRKFSNINLVIPGPYTEHTDKLIEQVRELKLENKIIFTGQIKESELQKLYKYTAVYCYPSPEEDFGLGPLEAGGWGVPTVAWDHAGPTITVKDGKTGFLADPYDVNDYAEKILKILTNKKLRLKMGKAAWLNTKNKFSWEKHLDILEEAVKQNLKNV